MKHLEAKGSTQPVLSIPIYCLRFSLADIVAVRIEISRTSMGLESSKAAGSLSVMSATCLLAGGTVGAGIIALPAKTHDAGFVPTMVGLCCCWALMYASAMLLLELSLWYGDVANISTMAGDTLGAFAKLACVGIYLFVYGATMVAYIAEAPKFILAFVQGLTGFTMPAWVAAAAFTFLFGFVVYSGTKPIDRVNSLCMAGCMVVYTLLLLFAVSRVRMSNLVSVFDWGESLSHTPLMVVALSFHNMVPSLPRVMGSKEEVAKAILLGSLLPLLMYVLWEGAILGSLQQGETIKSVHDVVNGLKMVGGEPVVVCFQIFSFLAIVTSFLGVGLGCLDFVQDLLLGLNLGFISDLLHPPQPGEVPWVDFRRAIPLSVLLLPSFGIAVCYPQAFLSALEVSGISRLILFSIMPAWMVWTGRRYHSRSSLTFGGDALLIAVVVVSCVIIVLGLW